MRHDPTKTNLSPVIDRHEAPAPTGTDACTHSQRDAAGAWTFVGVTMPWSALRADALAAGDAVTALAVFWSEGGAARTWEGAPGEMPEAPPAPLAPVTLGPTTCRRVELPEGEGVVDAEQASPATYSYSFEMSTGRWADDRGRQPWAVTRAKAQTRDRAVLVRDAKGYPVWQGRGSEVPEAEPRAQRVSIEWGCNAEVWWDAARGRGAERVPACLLPLIDGRQEETTLSPAEAYEARRWCEGLPGWSPEGADARSPHPLFFRDADPA